MRDPTREAAFDLLSAVLERRRPLEEALDALPEVPARDRAAAHRLAAAVLRRMGTLDAVLEPLLRKEPPEPVRHVLRIGAAGLLLLETPSHAAVATAVALARARGLTPFAGLVNAVLRRVSEAGVAAMEELDAPGWIRRPGCGRPGASRRGQSRWRTSTRRRSTDAAARCAAAGGWRTAADGSVRFPSGPGSRTSGFADGRLLGAGRCRRIAGAAAGGAAWRACGGSVCGARRQGRSACRRRVLRSFAVERDRGATDAAARQPAAWHLHG